MKIVALAASLALATAAMPTHAAPATAHRAGGHCNAAPYHQLDFWLGDWDTFEADGSNAGKSEARNHVTSILGGCVVLERYSGSNGLTGESFSIYDAARDTWHQTWVTNRGRLLMVEGRMRNGRMVLEGNDRDAHGKPVRVRVAWWPIKHGVREKSVASHDGGRTWSTQFDIVFRAHRP